MAEDFRVKSSWRASGKRRRLKRTIGLEGVIAIEDLWSYCASERQDGDLSGLTNEEISSECPDWERDPDELIDALVGCRLLDGEPGRYKIHDWADHQPFVTATSTRSSSASANAFTRWHIAGKHEEEPEEECPLCVGNAPHDAKNAVDTNAQIGNAGRNAPSIHPSIHPDERDGANGVLKTTEVEAVGYPRYGQLAGAGLVAIRKLGDIHRSELTDAMQTPGKSWKYAAKVIASMRDEAAQPPGSGRSRAGPGIERSAFRDATERAMEWARVEDAKDAAAGIHRGNDPPQGMLPAARG